MEFVFGYGSLASHAAGGPLTVASLTDHVRVWDVAMDNAATIPGYKYYVDPVTAERPAVHVTFLDVTPAAGCDCVGFLVPLAGPADLVALDRRERNYDRVEVTPAVRVHSASAPEPDRVWTYVATPAARARYAAAAAAGTAVIQRAYLEGVERAFAARGLAERYRASTRPPRCPIRALNRVNDSSRT